MTDNYYIYLHIKLTTGEPFYVGKGKDRRYLCKRYRSLHWRNVVNKHGYDIIFLEENLTEDMAHSLEKYWIARIGRADLDLGPLVNFTNGGEGSSGRKATDKMRATFSRCNRLRDNSPLQRSIVGARYRGKSGALHNKSIAIHDTVTGQIFGSISEASRILNKPISSIHYQIGKRFQAVKP